MTVFDAAAVLPAGADLATGPDDRCGFFALAPPVLALAPPAFAGRASVDLAAEGGGSIASGAAGNVGVMREVLAMLLAFRHPVGITTKGTLIERDLDLLVPLGKAMRGDPPEPPRHQHQQQRQQQG